jgi:ribosomal protein L16 Arg81 hydroxylase
MTQERYEAAFRRLFEPLTIERFVAEIWPSRLFYDEPRAERLAALEALLGPTDLDSLLAAHDASGPAYVCTKPEGNLKVEIVPCRQARVGFTAGSFILKQMHHALPSLGASVQLLKRLCGLPAEDEVCDSHVHYSTPGEGFSVHFDEKDIIMVQLRGTKTWWVGETPYIEAPITHCWPITPPTDDSLQPEEGKLRRFDLAPGSLLFIPRGHLHKTEALDESIAVTFGFLTKSWAELVVDKLKHALIQDVDWRRPVHDVAPSTAAPRQAEARATVEDLLRRLVPAVRALAADDFVAGVAGVADVNQGAD